MKQTVIVDVPEGFEALAYRPLVRGDWYLAHCGPSQAAGSSTAPWLILRKVEPVKESRWVNVHNKSTLGYPRVAASECNFHEHPNGRAGLIRLDFAGDDLVAVALEPLTPAPTEG